MEWYHPWSNLATTLTQYMDVEDAVLVCGCGNSEMSVDMYDGGESTQHIQIASQYLNTKHSGSVDSFGDAV